MTKCDVRQGEIGNIVNKCTAIYCITINLFEILQKNSVFCFLIITLFLKLILSKITLRILLQLLINHIELFS
jgi:hypothetical protein